MENRKPAEIFPPGEFIADELEARGWSQIELAEILNRPARLVSELVSGKRAITPETARGLGAAFGTGPQFWMNLERDYQLSKAVHDDSSVERRARLYGKAPVKEMIRRGWIQPSPSIDVLEVRVKQFTEIECLDDEPLLAHAARKTATYDDIAPSEWAWIFRVRQIARSVATHPFSQELLAASIGKLESLLIAPEEARNVPRILGDCGVRFVIVEKLPQSKIDGVCLWLDDTSPVIGMSMRRDKIDNFWFVLRHEIEHVLRGDCKDGTVIDAALEGKRAGTGNELPEMERAANAAASDFCAPATKLDSFMARKHPFYYERDVLAFAQIMHRHPGLVVGQMQYRLDNYSYLSKHLVKIRHIVLPGAIADGWDQTPANLVG